jgi:hypothetical protein
LTPKKAAQVLLCAHFNSLFDVFSERPNINPKEEVRLLHSHYLDVLAYSIERSQPNKHGRVLINLFRILPMLQTIHYEQAIVIGTFRADKPPGNTYMYYA